MSIKLYSHNEKAYLSAVSMLRETGKAAVIHPTGTGKSFIGFRLCQDNPEKHICWLSPSEYIFKTQIENAIKSDTEFNPDNITFITYSKLILMNNEELADIAPDFIVLDEFHRCGAAEWGNGIKRLLDIFSQTPLLGLSATNIRYLDNHRDMALELFGGNIASEITLGEAIARNILKAPKYIISMYSYEKELEQISRKISSKKYVSVRQKAEQKLAQLRRSLEKADKINELFQKHIQNPYGKYIVFCSDCEHLNEMSDLAEDWFSGIDKNPHIYKAYYADSTAGNEFENFKKDNSNHLKLLYCIDMLNEGIHIDDISGVILLRPTVSPIIYKQQIGRALSVSHSDEPIIFDIVNNFENLYSISAIEEEMFSAVTYYRYCGNYREIINERFEITDDTKNSRKLFEELEDTLNISWDFMYEYAKQYFDKHGHLNIPKHYKTADGYSLGYWIATQRKVYQGKQNGILNESRIKLLNDIDMIWDSLRDVSWNKHFNAAKQYFLSYNSLNPPIDYICSDGTELGKWLSRLRTYRKSGICSNYLTPERIKMLDTLNMVWDVPDYLWNENYSAALEFFKTNGHLIVPHGYISQNGIKLDTWISKLRRQKQSGLLKKEQIEKLNELHMCWENKYDRIWNRNYAEAKSYYLQHGNLNVPVSYVTPSGFKLGDWISNQREAQSKMNTHRKEQLNAIGMIWKKNDPWEIRYLLAEEYYKANGNLEIPATYKPNGIWLNKWLNEQKQIYRGNRPNKQLSDEQIKRLEKIRINWNLPKNARKKYAV